MLSDATKYQTLQKEKEEEARHYRVSQENMLKQHEAAVTEQLSNHTTLVEIQKNQIEQLKTEIKTMQRDNEETMRQIIDDANKEIEDIESKNQKSLQQVNDMGLKSKADLQLTKNKLTDTELEIDKLTRQKQDKD